MMAPSAMTAGYFKSPIRPSGSGASKDTAARQIDELQRCLDVLQRGLIGWGGDRFTGLPLLVEYMDGINWRVARSCSYRLADGRVSTIRAPFELDFASVPRVFWRVFPKAGDGRNLYGIAAAWHDWLYRHKKIAGVAITRAEADRVFLEIMLYLRVAPWVAHTMYRAVRIGGEGAWRNAA